MFLIFGLASLAPAVYAAASLFGQRFEEVWPGLSRTRWTLVGTAAAWILIATGRASRLEAIFSILGAVLRRPSARWRPIMSGPEGPGPGPAAASTSRG